MTTASSGTDAHADGGAPSPDTEIGALVASKDPWSIIDRLATSFTPSHAAACEARFDGAGPEGRKRLVWLLERGKGDHAWDTLLRLLPRTTGSEASQILRALSAARVKAPSDQIRRLLAEDSEAAVVAAGISGDATFADTLVTKLRKGRIGRHAALSLAMLGRRDLAGEIASRIAGADALDVAGFAVALEVLNEPSVVPFLRGLLDDPKVESKWDVHHALCRLTGRDPFVRLSPTSRATADAVADAWRTYDHDAPLAPRLETLAFAADGRDATFDLVDGRASVRIDYLPPTPGSSWPRWDLALFAGDRPVYAVGSRCGTCETTLTMIGSAPEEAAARAADIRESLADVAQIDAALITALEPFLTTLRTGHYVARLVDLELEQVTDPARSWLTRCRAARSRDDHAVAPRIVWPGVTHFQTLASAWETIPTYGIVAPMASLATLDKGTIGRHAEAIGSGAHPTALVMAWVEDKEVRGEFPERFLMGVVLDGHHKLAAYTALERPARCLLLCRIEDSWGPPDDRAGPLRAAVNDLSNAGTRAVRDR